MYTYIWFNRQSKKKKSAPPEIKVTEEPEDKNIAENNKDDEVEGPTNELEIKVEDNTEKELEDTELKSNPVKNEKETNADESLADVESLPESQSEQPAKSSKSKRSTERKSKSRSSRASKYDMNTFYKLILKKKCVSVCINYLFIYLH